MTQERLPPQDPEAIFRAFVRNANAEGSLSRTVQAPSVPPPRVAAHADAWSGPGEATQVRQADEIVPEVARISAPDAPIPEGSDDGQVPAGELDRMLVDMAVLVRYGHVAESKKKLDEFVSRYPHDLLLLRRLSEFYVEHGRTEEAAAFLFQMAAALFQRGNQVGVRRALEQVRLLAPDNAKAAKLLALLDRRELRVEQLVR